jgi:hypothetical protein
MIPSVSPVVLLLSLAIASPSAARPAGPLANVQANSGPTSRSGRVDVRLFDLAAVRRLFHPSLAVATRSVKASARPPSPTSR